MLNARTLSSFKYVYHLYVYEPYVCAMYICSYTQTIVSVYTWGKLDKIGRSVEKIPVTLIIS